MRSLRCENRKQCLTAYRNVDFAPHSYASLTCPECGALLLEPRRFTSRKQHILFAVQLLLVIIGVLSLIFLRSEAAELYDKISSLLR